MFARSDGLSGDYIHRLFEDREGNIRVDTLDGLDRFGFLNKLSLSNVRIAVSGIMTVDEPNSLPIVYNLGILDSVLWYPKLRKSRRCSETSGRVIPRHPTN
jgi:hypothetical protein